MSYEACRSQVCFLSLVPSTSAYFAWILNLCVQLRSAKSASETDFIMLIKFIFFAYNHDNAKNAIILQALRVQMRNAHHNNKLTESIKAAIINTLTVTAKKWK